MKLVAAVVLLMGASAGVLVAQGPGAPRESASFVVLKGTDTVAVEQFHRYDVAFKGALTLRHERPVTESWSVVTGPDGHVPLVEVTVSQVSDDPRMKPLVMTRSRLIFRGDSVAIDQMTSSGLVTKVLPTEAGAMPYLNLSFGLLEVAIRESPKDSVISIPFLNLGGGQTAHGKLVRGKGGAAQLTLGPTVFDLVLGPEGTIESAAIPSQGVTVVRGR